MDTEKHDNQENISPSGSVEAILSGEGIYYKCGDVARLLGIKPDSVRYYTEAFSEFLHPEKTKKDKGGHRLYSDEDIALLRTILNLLKKYSAAEVRAQLRDPELRIIMASNTERKLDEERSLLAHNEYLINQLTVAMCEAFSKALEKQANEIGEQYQKIFIQQQQEFDFLKEQNTRLTEKLEHINEALSSIEENKKNSKFRLFNRRK